MIDPKIAQQLKQAGLEWEPAKRDNFMIPDGPLADEVYTLNDQTIWVQSIKGQHRVTFHGAAEWALDDVLVSDVVWLPSETQLREAIQLRLGGDAPALELSWSLAGYRCTITHLDRQHTFEEASAEHAYADALLFLLQRERLARHTRPVDTA